MIEKEMKDKLMKTIQFKQRDIQVYCKKKQREGEAPKYKNR